MWRCDGLAVKGRDQSAGPTSTDLEGRGPLRTVWIACVGSVLPTGASPHGPCIHTPAASGRLGRAYTLEMAYRATSSALSWRLGPLRSGGPLGYHSPSARIPQSCAGRSSVIWVLDWTDGFYALRRVPQRRPSRIWFPGGAHSLRYPTPSPIQHGGGIAPSWSRR